LSRTSANAASVSMDVHVENAEYVENAAAVERTAIERDAVTDVVTEVAAASEGLAMRASGGATGVMPDPPLSKARIPGLGASASYAEMSDEELLAGIRLQSEDHFGELYNRYFQRIYNFVFARMRNHAEAEEVVQETFLAVFRSFENYRGQSSLLSWIYGIAKNTANNSLRRAKSQNERIDLADDEDLIPRPSIGVATPDEQLDLNRFRDLLSSRLEGLADWQTEIFHLRHFENLSIPEISARTARSSDAVRSSLYRVKRLFFEAASANPGHASHGTRGVRR
jgi:RNA polymerase sigma-70 factor, ECF subfamily